MQRAPQLLLMDADLAFCRMLSDYLQGQGFGVTVARDAEMDLLQAAEGCYDLVILGDTRSVLGGLEVLKRIRKQGELPVVILTAKNDDIDRIVGLEVGADDYLSKSCNLRELASRLRCILRRVRGKNIAEKSAAPIRQA